MFFFFSNTATPEIYTLSLHDALPISGRIGKRGWVRSRAWICDFSSRHSTTARSEEHTSELQSRGHLVCRLLLEKKKKHPMKGKRSQTTTQNSHAYLHHIR